MKKMKPWLCVLTVMYQLKQNVPFWCLLNKCLCRLQTVNLKTSMKQTTRLLLDCGSQRTYTSEDLVDKLQLRPNNSEIVTVFTFGSTKPKEFKAPVVEFVWELKTETYTKGTQSCFRSVTALFKISSRKKTLREWTTKLKKGQ